MWISSCCFVCIVDLQVARIKTFIILVHIKFHIQIHGLLATWPVCSYRYWWLSIKWNWTSLALIFKPFPLITILPLPSVLLVGFHVLDFNERIREVWSVYVNTKYTYSIWNIRHLRKKLVFSVDFIQNFH